MTGMDIDEFRDVIRSGARGVEASPQLFDRVRRRVRRRRVRLAGATAVAGSLGVAGVALGWPLTPDTVAPEIADGFLGPDQGSASSPPDGLDEVADPLTRRPPETREVEHAGVQFDVPMAWRIVDADALARGELDNPCNDGETRLVLGGVSRVGCELSAGQSDNEVVVASVAITYFLAEQLAGELSEGRVSVEERDGLTFLDARLNAGVLSQRPTPEGDVRIVVVPGLRIALEGPSELLDELLPTLRAASSMPPTDQQPPLTGHAGTVLISADGRPIDGWTDDLTLADQHPARTVASPTSTLGHTVVASLEPQGERSTAADPDIDFHLVVRAGPAEPGGAREVWRHELPSVPAEGASAAPAPVWSPDGRSLAWLEPDGRSVEAGIASWHGTEPIVGEPNTIEATRLGRLDIAPERGTTFGGTDPALFAPAAIGWQAGDGRGVLQIGNVLRHGIAAGPPVMEVPVAGPPS